MSLGDSGIKCWCVLGLVLWDGLLQHELLLFLSFWSSETELFLSPPAPSVFSVSALLGEDPHIHSPSLTLEMCCAFFRWAVLRAISSCCFSQKHLSLTCDSISARSHATVKRYENFRIHRLYFMTVTISHKFQYLAVFCLFVIAGSSELWMSECLWPTLSLPGIASSVQLLRTVMHLCALLQTLQGFLEEDADQEKMQLSAAAWRMRGRYR